MSAYQRAVTFNHSYVFGGSALTNFPVIVGGTYSWLATVANGGHVINSSGIDIYFTSDSAATVLLPFERVAYNPVTGACEFWVQIPSLSNSVDTVFYINYGDSAVLADLSNKNGVWDSNHVAVYHFGDGTTLDCTDSTANGNNGTNHGATATSSLLAQGQGAAHFTQASSQYIDCGTGASLNLTTGLTMEVCITANSNDVNRSYIGKGYGNSNGYDGRLNGSWDLGWALRTGGTEVSRYQASIGLGTNYLAFTYDNTTGKFYYNNSGGNNFSSPLTNSWSSAIGSNSAIPLRIGAFSDLSAYFDGTLDEVRISNVARSSGWIQTQAWQSGVPLTSPSVSYSVGSESGISGGAITGGAAVRGNIDWDQVQLAARLGNVHGAKIQYADGTFSAGNLPKYMDDGTLTDSGIAISGSGTAVTSVTASSPLSSTGGATPDISVSQASSSVFGVVKVDGTTITASGGVISAVGGGGGGGGGGSVPSGCPSANLYLWFAADQLVGYANNDPLVHWPNLASGDSNPMITGISPTYKTNIINSLPAISFSGSDFAAGIAPLLVCGIEFSFFLVLKITSLANAYTGIITSNTGMGFYIKSNGKTAYYCTGTNYDGTGSATYGTGSFYVVSVTVGAAGIVTRQALASDFSSASTSFTSNSTQPRLGIGYDPSTGGRLLTGYIPELIVYGRQLNSTDVSTVENYLKTKYGL